MEVLTADYIVENIIDNRVQGISSNALNLWVWHADKIPPHIGVSYDGKYFSLKANGKDEGMHLSTVEKIIKTKGIVTLCFELAYNNADVSLENAFSDYKKTIPGEVTCLTPIKGLFNVPFAAKLTELLRVLDDQDQIRRVVGFNIPEGFSGIKNYSPEEIHERLKKLDNAL